MPDDPIQHSTLEDDSGSDYTMSMLKANVVGALAFPFAALVVLVPFLALHGSLALETPPFTIVFFAVAFALSIIVHEALHAVGFIFVARAPRSSVHFGLDRKTLTPFAGCKVPVRAWAYRIACFLPALVLGFIPAAIALIIGNAALALFATLMIAMAGGDFAAMIAMRRVPGHTFVLDHPSRVGCKVVSP